MLVFSRYSWWVGAMVGLALLLTVASRVGILNPFQGIFLTLTSPIESGLTTVFKPVASYLGDVGDLSDLQAENRALRAENERLENQLLELEHDAQRFRELEQALGIVEGTGDVLVAASVVSRNRTAYTDTIGIDKGAADGLSAGNIVLSSEGSLVGTVTTVLDNRAFVRLITDSTSRVNAQVFDTGADGVVKGTPDRTLILDLGQGDINQGDRVTTSGLGGGYPPNIPIGTVKEVSGSPQDLYPKVTIEPRVRLSTVTTVLVNTTFVPSRAGIGAE